MKAIKKIDVKKVKTKGLSASKTRQSLAVSGSKAVAGCPELKYQK